MGVKNISALELGEIIKYNQLSIIDIRPTAEYLLGHIPGSKNISLGLLLQSPERFLNLENKYYIICDEGKKSIALCFELGKQGYNLINVLGGITAYRGPLENI